MLSAEDESTKALWKLRSTLPAPHRHTAETFIVLLFLRHQVKVNTLRQVLSHSRHGSGPLGTCLRGQSQCVLFSIETHGIKPTNSHVQNMYDHILIITNTFPSLLSAPSWWLYKSTYLLTLWSRVLLEKLTGSAASQSRFKIVLGIQ